jgi:hypothetical protein
MASSHRLHQLMVHGAIEQQNSRVEFDVGYCSGSISKLPYLKGIQISLVKYTTVHWVSPRLRKIWDNGQGLEVPIDLMSISGLEKALKVYPVDRILQRLGEMKASPDVPEQYTLSKRESECVLQTISLQKYDRGTESIRPGDGLLKTLRAFLLFVQGQNNSEDCVLVMGRSRDGNHTLFHTHAGVEVDDLIFGFPRTDCLALVREDGRAGMEEFIGRAIPFQPQKIPNFMGGPFQSFDIDLSTIQAFSQVLV